MDLTDIILKLITEMAAQHPWIMTFFFVVGVLRAINKPLFALAHKFVEQTPSPKDDEVLRDVELSNIYKAVSFFLDWSMSVKLPQEKPAAPAPQEKP